MIGNLRPQLPHQNSEQIRQALLTTTASAVEIGRKYGAHRHTVRRLATRLMMQGFALPSRVGRICETCGLSKVTKPGAVECHECRYPNTRTKVCSEPDCLRVVAAKGKCHRCYQRDRYLSTPEARAKHAERTVSWQRRRRSETRG